MFRTKKDVDRHVSDILSKIYNENEKNFRGYNFARLYYQVKDYESARTHVTNYLSARDYHAPSHKLLAQIHEATGDVEKALQSYKRSLEVDANQKDIVLKICELYCHLPVDHETARYWVDRGDKLFPHHDTVFRLREYLVSSEGEPDREELERLISSELAAQPNSLNLSIKLLRLYLDTDRVKDAYEQAIKVEKKNPFPTSTEWYYMLVDVFEAYEEELGQELDSNFYILYLTALDHLVYLTLAEPHAVFRGEERSKQSHAPTITDAASVLFQFDQRLKVASEKDLSHGAWLYFLNHMKGQLYFHLGSLVMKRAKNDHGNWKEACRIASAFFLVGYTFKPGSLLQEVWFSQMTDQQKIYTKFYQQASMRTSFIGHVIISLCKEDKNKWLQKAKSDTCISQVQERTYNRLFSNVNEKNEPDKSYFLTNSAFTESSLEFPIVPSLLDYDKSCLMMCSSSLHHVVWLHMQWKKSSNEESFHSVLYEAFKGLQFSNSHLSKGNPESLCLLDVEAFLLATLFVSNLYVEQRSAITSPHDNSPLLMPPDISESLCTTEQASWWFSAHGLVNNIIKERLGEHRRTLQRGLEVIRGIGNHGLEVQLVVHLARVFSDRASALSADLECIEGDKNENEKIISDKVASLELRALQYWSIALNMLDKLEANQSLRVPKQSIFQSYSKSVSKEEVVLLKEEGQLYVACRLMNSGKLEEAAELLEKLRSPFASYYLVLAYKKLALQEDTTSVVRTVFLNKAKNALYLTMDRISGDTSHSLNEEIYIELDDIESELEKQMNNANSYDSTNNDELDHSNSLVRSGSKSQTPAQKSHMQSTPKLSSRFVTPRSKSHHENNTNRTHLEPSPERLDAQIRALALTQSTLVKTLVEQQQSLLDTNKAIIEELKQNKEVVVQLKKQLEELQVSCVKGQQRASSHRKCSAAKGQGDDEDHYNDYEENGILDYYMDNNVDSYRQSVYGYNHARVMPDGAGASVNYMPQATLPPGPPPPLAPYNYQYPPPPHGLPAQPAPTAALAERPQYYHAPLSHGLPLSEGQPLPQFRFHVASPMLKQPVMNSVSSIPQVIPTTTTLPVMPQSVVAPPIPQSSVQPSPSWTKPGAIPHAFQIPLPSPSAIPLATQSSTAFSAPFMSPLPVQPPQTFISSLPSTSASTIHPATSGSHLQAMLSSMPSSVPSSTVFAGVPNSLSQTPLQSTSGFSFASTTAAVVSSPEMNRSRQDSEACSDNDVEREVMGDFKPVIPLPAEVTVQTGEEEETVLFENRAKLFRFVDREWKERGVGIVKILKHEPSGRVRLLMRRDQVLKICANHYILPSMEISPLKGSDKAYTWGAQDFADETVKLEQFCIRFKTPDVAALFRKAFEAAVNCAKLSEKKNKESAALKSKTPAVKPVVSDAKPLAPQSAVFGASGLPKPGSWSCGTCYLNNDGNRSTCIACGAAKSESVLPTSADDAPASRSPFTVSSGASPPTPATTASEKGGWNFSEKPFIFQSPVISINETVSKIGDSAVTKDGALKPLNLSSQVEVHSSDIPVRTDVSNTVFGKFSFSSSEITTKPDVDVAKPITSQQLSVGEAKSKAVNIDRPVSIASGLMFTSSTSVSSQSQSVSITPVVSSSSSAQVEKPVSTFGGFTFTSTPVITEKDADIKDREILVVSTKQKESPQVCKIDSKSSPFSGFSFKVSPVKSVTDKPFAGSKASQSLESGSRPSESSAVGSFGGERIFGSSSSASSLQFSSLANSSPSSKTSSPGTKGFSGTGSPLFVTLTKDGRRVSGEFNENTPEEFVPTVDFKPVVPLPALVDTKTGEEEEEKVFGERAKLYRYDTDTKEWKECGVGELKILYQRDMNKYRILMRRDQVLKICANHYILPEMKLSPMATGEKSWMWYAQDFSKGDLTQEKFAARFKNVDIARQFFSTFEKCRTELDNSKKPGTASKETDNALSTKAAGEVFPLGAEEDGLETSVDLTTGNKLSFSEVFKPEPGSWECTTCYIRNERTRKICQACESGRPGSSPKPSESNASSSSVAATSQSTVSTSASVQSIFKQFQFDAPARTAGGMASSAFVFGTSEASKTPLSTGFVFGAKNANPQPTFQFGGMTGGFKPNLAGNSNSGTGAMFGGMSFSPESSVTSSSSSSNENLPKSSAISITPVTAPPSFVFNKSASGVTSSVSDTTTTTTTDSAVSMPVSIFPFSFSSTSTTSSGGGSVGPVEFRFGSPQKYEFNFSGVRPHSPTKCPKSPRSPGTPTDVEGEDEDEVEPSDVDGIYFQPVIPLPPKVDVKTGEEDETVLFSKRAKLFRFTNSEWKERGIGDIKILRNEKLKKIRLLMRRDQVLKVCLNHYLTEDIVFTSRSDKSWSWAAVDYSENEPCVEQFAVRFKTPELATEFKEALDSALPEENVSVAKEKPKAAAPQASTTSSILSSFNFKLPSETKKTEVSDVDSVRKCLDFALDNVGAESEQKVERTPKTGTATESSYVDKLSSFSFSLGGQKPESSPFPLSSKFCVTPTSTKPFSNTSSFFAKPLLEAATKSVESDPEVEVVFEATPTPEQIDAAKKLMLPPTFFLYENKPPCPGCRGCEGAKPLAIKHEEKKSEIAVAKPAQTEAKTDDEQPLFFTNTSVSGVSFADLASKSNGGFGVFQGTSVTSPPKTMFPGAGAPVFGSTPTGQTNEDEDGEVSQGPDIHFEPVVPLPDIVEVKTGEEDENVIFCAHAKLYKYDGASSQWKERGVGDMKILEHKDKRRFRLLMRRDQVFKVACNHAVAPGLKLESLATTDRSLCWATVDYSEGTPESVKFAIRFKKKETLVEFQNKFEECKSVLSIQGNDADTKSPPEAKSESQVISDSSISLQPTSQDDVVQSCLPVSLVEELVPASTEASQSVSHKPADTQEELEEYEYDDDDEDDDDLMFEKRVSFEASDEGTWQLKTSGIGSLQVLYDDSVYGYRVMVINDKKEIMCDHIIAIQTCLWTEKKTAAWSAVDINVDPPRRRQFRATFSSNSALDEFRSVFEEGKTIAVQSEIVEKSEGILMSPSLGD